MNNDLILTKEAANEIYDLAVRDVFTQYGLNYDAIKQAAQNTAPPRTPSAQTQQGAMEQKKKDAQNTVYSPQNNPYKPEIAPMAQVAPPVQPMIAQASDYDQGFITKCAEYGVNPYKLAHAYNMYLNSGMTKEAGFGDWLGEQGQGLLNGLADAGDWVRNTANSVGEGISNAASSVGDFVSNLPSTAYNMAADAGDVIRRGANTVGDYVGAGARGLGHFANAMGTGLQGLGNMAGEAIGAGARGIGNYIGGTASNMINNPLSTLATFTNPWTAGANLLSGGALSKGLGSIGDSFTSGMSQGWDRGNQQYGGFGGGVSPSYGQGGYGQQDPRGFGGPMYMGTGMHQGMGGGYGQGGQGGFNPMMMGAGVLPMMMGGGRQAMRGGPQMLQGLQGMGLAPMLMRSGQFGQAMRGGPQLFGRPMGGGQQQQQQNSNMLDLNNINPDALKGAVGMASRFLPQDMINQFAGGVAKMTAPPKPQAGGQSQPGQMVSQSNLGSGNSQRQQGRFW